MSALLALGLAWGSISPALAVEDAFGNLQIANGVITQWLPASAITVTASSAYSAGNEVGALLTFTLPTGYLTGILQGVQINVKSAQSNAYKLYLFTANPA